MDDSNAQESEEDEESPYLKDGEKNAHEYFKELEENKSKDTPPEGMNSNADGSSIFN